MADALFRAPLAERQDRGGQGQTRNRASEIRLILAFWEQGGNPGRVPHSAFHALSLEAEVFCAHPGRGQPVAKPHEQPVKHTPASQKTKLQRMLNVRG